MGTRAAGAVCVVADDVVHWPLVMPRRAVNLVIGVKVGPNDAKNTNFLQRRPVGATHCHHPAAGPRCPLAHKRADTLRRRRNGAFAVTTHTTLPLLPHLALTSQTLIIIPTMYHLPQAWLPLHLLIERD